MTRDASTLAEAVDALKTALDRQDVKAGPLDWEGTQNDLALAQRRLGGVTNDLALRDTGWTLTPPT